MEGRDFSSRAKRGWLLVVGWVDDIYVYMVNVSLGNS